MAKTNIEDIDRNIYDIKNKDNYEFKRGYDTNGTKRYNVNYQVNCYFCL